MKFNVDDPNLKIHFLTEIARNFSGFVVGTGGNNSLATFSPAISLNDNIIKQQTEGRQDSKNTETLSHNIKLDVMSRIIDSTTGAFFTHDILYNDDVYSGVKNLPKGQLDEYLAVLHEDSGYSISPTLGDVILSTRDSLLNISENKIPASMKDVVKYIEETAPPLTADSNNTANQNPSTQRTPLYICNEQIGSNPNLSFPGLSAFVIKDPSLSIQSKNANYLSVFFNAIPMIEMMKCTPFIKMTFYEKNFKTDEQDFLNPTSYMRFYKDKDGSFVTDDNLGLGRASEVNTPTHPGAKNAQATHMNIFTAPQTLNNADINKELFSSMGNSSKTSDFTYTLEPFAPMLTLQNLNVGITGGGFGLTSSKRATMSLVLHDRSRMKDVAPLISVNQLMNTIVKIEFGWSHPEGDFNAQQGGINQIGYFLNALRDVSFYTLNSSDIRFEGSTANINVKMTALGQIEHKTVPASCGRLVPLSVVRGQILSAINSLTVKLNKERGEDNHLTIHSTLEVLKSSINTGFAAVDATLYRNFLDVIRPENPDPNEVVRALLLMFEEDPYVVDTELLNLSVVTSGFTSVRTQELLNKINTKAITKINRDEILKKYEDLLEAPDYFASPRSRSRLSYKKNSTKNDLALGGVGGIAPIVTPLSEVTYSQDTYLSEDQISLGTLMCAFVGAPMVSTSEYAEVQMIFHPINNKAGGGRIHTTASLPLFKDDVKKAFKKIFEGENDRASFLTIQAITALFSEIAEAQDEIYTPGGYNLGVTPQQFIESEEPNTTVKDLLEKINAKIEDVATTYVEAGGTEADKDLITAAYDAKEPTDEQKELLNRAVTIHFNKVSGEKTTEVLKEIYKEDGMYEENVNMLVKPIIRIAFETLPAIDPTPVNPRDRAGQNQLGRAIAALGDNTDSDTKTGYQDSAKIMRIHVYDANSSMSPPADLVNNMMADLSIEVGGESVDDASNNSDQSFFEKIVDLSRNGKRENPTLVKLEDVTTQDLKAYVKRQFPSITYGSANSVVTDVSISSTTTDKVAQAFAYQFENERRGARTTTGPSRVDTGVTVFPANISVEMLGMPFVSMGNQIYLDLGTNTDLDNVYAVYNVTHTIQAGKFVSKIDMKLSNQGMARNVRGDIVKAAKRMVAAKG